MKRQHNTCKYLLVLFLVLLGTLSLVAGCAVNKAPHTQPDMNGVITEIDQENQAILLEQNSKFEEGPKDWVEIEKTTKIYFENEQGKLVQAEFAEFVTGQRVKAWYQGAILESYPRQAKAKVIIIKQGSN